MWVDFVCLCIFFFYFIFFDLISYKILNEKTKNPVGKLSIRFLFFSFFFELMTWNNRLYILDLATPAKTYTHTYTHQNIDWEYLNLLSQSITTLLFSFFFLLVFGYGSSLFCFVFDFCFSLLWICFLYFKLI